MKLFATTPIIAPGVDATCLEYQTTHIEQHLLTQTQTSIVYNHCTAEIMSTDKVDVSNYFVMMPLAIILFFLVIKLLEKLIEYRKS